jgi:hypothetical protein
LAGNQPNLSLKEILLRVPLEWEAQEKAITVLSGLNALRVPETRKIVLHHLISDAIIRIPALSS